MYYEKDMPLVPSSGWGHCDDLGCPGKKSRQQAFGYLVDHNDPTRMSFGDGRRKRLVLAAE
jgi:hypothetical protein